MPAGNDSEVATVPSILAVRDPTGRVAVAVVRPEDGIGLDQVVVDFSHGEQPAVPDPDELPVVIGTTKCRPGDHAAGTATVEEDSQIPPTVAGEVDAALLDAPRSVVRDLLQPQGQR